MECRRIPAAPSKHVALFRNAFIALFAALAHASATSEGISHNSSTIEQRAPAPPVLPTLSLFPITPNVQLTSSDVKNLWMFQHHGMSITQGAFWIGPVRYMSVPDDQPVTLDIERRADGAWRITMKWIEEGGQPVAKWLVHKEGEMAASGIELGPNTAMRE